MTILEKWNCYLKIFWDNLKKNKVENKILLLPPLAKILCFPPWYILAFNLNMWHKMAGSETAIWVHNMELHDEVVE